MKKIISFIFLTAFLSGFSQRYANEFLYLGTDAAGMALGGNNVAGVSGGQAGFWNPAGLVRMEHNQLSLMHAAYFANMALIDFASYARKADKNSAFSFSLLRFGVDNIMNTTQLIDENGNVDYSRIRYFSAADYALFIGYARKNWFRHWDIGINAKLIYRHIGDFASGYGLGFDVGAQYQRHSWKIGLMLRDITTTYTYWTFNQNRLDEIAGTIPGYNQTAPEKSEFSYPSIQMGIAKNWKIKKNYGLSVELDARNYFYKRHALVQTSVWSMEPGLAVTGDYKNKVFLRMGLSDIYPTDYYGEKYWQMKPSAGLGIRFKYIQVDYAFTTISKSSLYSHIFSLFLDLRIFKKSS